MDLRNNKDLQRAQNKLRYGMLSYLEIEDAAYTEKDVNTCEEIIELHLVRLSSLADRESAMELVQETVEQLNELCERTEYEMIETDQRELICEIIITAGFILGFNKENEDVTEEWREW